jgi:methionyl-tRNA formyltransferase
MDNINPDLILSVNCNVRLPQLLLQKAKFGGVNLHQGSLPSYKGLMPIFYSQLAGEKKVSSSIHIMNSDFDSGEILVQEEIDILPGENYAKIWKKINQVGSANLIKVLSFFEENSRLPSGLRQEVIGRYYSLPSIKLVMYYFFLQMSHKFRVTRKVG